VCVSGVREPLGGAEVEEVAEADEGGDCDVVRGLPGGLGVGVGVGGHGAG
jgi:hypothetical protein